MNDQRVKTDNEVIAEFMGYETTLLNGVLPCAEIGMAHIPLGNPNYSEFDYKGNWNALMEVVEKISLFVYESQIEDNGLEESKKVLYDRAHLRTFGMISDEGQWMVRLNRMPLHSEETLKEATYKAVVEFIHWYQKQKSS